MKRSTWRKVEKDVRRRSGGRDTPGSGNKGIKGDVQTTKTLNEDGSYDPGWHIEVKCTDNDRIIVQSLWFEKLIKESGRRHPALVVHLNKLNKGMAFSLCEEGNPTLHIKKTKVLSPEELVTGTIIEVGDRLWIMEEHRAFLRKLKMLKPGAPGI